MRTRTAGRALLAAALVLSAAAVAVDYASDRLVVPAAAFVHVRWAPRVDAAGREALERRFHLTEPEQTAETTYSYRLNDLSTDNIRDLVTHAAVADTQDIDRSAFSLSNSAERVIGDPASQRRAERLTRTVTLLWTAAAATGMLGLLLIAAPATMHRLDHWIRAGALSLVRTVYRRIPEVSAEAAAVFRIMFGSALVLVFAFSPLSASDVPSATLPDDTAWLMRAAGNVFVRSPRLADFINPWLLAWGTLFVAGALTRWSFAMLTAGALAWGVVYSLNSGHHPVSALLVALLCLLPSRWGDAWGVDAWMRRRPRQAGPREYGYSVWIPGVVLGVALAAAAASKLQEGGLGWITNGTVKYHFVTDAPNAPLDWGLRYGVIPGVAVALSFGTIAIESLVLPVALFGSPTIRMIAAPAAAAMFAGFWLFQGVAWPAWWVLLLSFAPWHRVAAGRAMTPRPAPVGPVTLRYVQAAIVVMLIAQQLIASSGRLEVPPLLSAYDMYSKTYSSPREYPADGGSAYWLNATRADGTTQSCRVGQDEARVPVAAQVLASCFGSERPIRALVVEETRPDIDWTAGRYLGTKRIRISGGVP